MNIWYRVSDLDSARDFYVRALGFEEVYVDEEDRWARLVRDAVEIAIAETEQDGGEEGVIATLDVPDVRAEAERLRASGVSVGTVVEIPGTIRLLDVFDPDGNRVQLSEDL